MSCWQRWTIAGVMLMSAIACTKREDNAGNGSAENSTDVMQSEQLSEADAQSSLSLKRGIVTLGEDTATFKPCGETNELWLVDQTQGTLQELLASATTPITLYAEAYGDRSAAPEQPVAAKNYNGAFVIEELLYTSAPSANSGCDAPTPDYLVAATGANPQWSVKVDRQQLRWRQADAAELVLPAEQAEDAEGAVSYQGRSKDHSLQLAIDAQVCRDASTGEFFAYSARATWDGKEFKGCARVGE